MVEGLELMGFGMGGIFVVIGIIYISMKLLIKFVKDKEPTETK